MKIKGFKNRGFTLIEVVIAIFLLMVGLLSISRLYPTGLKVGSASHYLTIASAIAQGKMEEMLSKNYDEIESSPRERADNDPESPFFIYEQETKVSFVDPENNLIEIPDDKGIKRIEVIIYWKEGEAEKRLNLNTFYSKR